MEYIMRNLKLILSAVLALCASMAQATQYSSGTGQEPGVHVSQTFEVDNMSCAACPITIRKAMSRVKGVQRVEVNLQDKSVTAIYDPALTEPAAIAEASSSVGFPAQAIGRSTR